MDLKIEYIRDKAIITSESESFTGTVEAAVFLATAQMVMNKADVARIIDAETEEELKAVVKGNAQKP